MEDDKQQVEQLLQTAPGGVVKLAFDDMLTILYATDKFFALVKNITNKTYIKLPASLLRMVYSADIIYLTQQIEKQKVRNDNMIALNFRTLKQDGSFRWIMISGEKTDETYQSGSKTVSVYSCIAVDSTTLMHSYKNLEQTAEYHRVIFELSKDIFFEYEIAKDTLTFSEVYREVFGRENIVTGFRKKLVNTKIIHEDELPAIVSIFNSMMSGRKQARFELRMIPKDGVPSWYTCYASIIFDENKNPYKLVGKLAMMNMISTDEVEKLFEPQLDVNSGVCTKNSAEQMISKASTKQRADAISALLVIDIRNYKTINEIGRIINGEDIFVSIGKVLKAHVRTNDVVGRIGVSEFVVYVMGIPSDRAVYELADKMCKEIEALYFYEHTKSCISASIGVAMHRGVSDYQKLLTNANTALVMAKKTPTSSFEVFSGTI